MPLQRSWLGQLYAPRFRAWADQLIREPEVVVAISRKGPRLLELLVQEGVLPPDFSQRVVSERALPFLRDLTGDVLVIDDSVTFGSTFDRTIRLAQIALQRSGSIGRTIGLPFAVSSALLSKYRQTIEGSYLDLDRDDAAAFVHDEMLALRLLGKPIDIDHPILSFSGNFGDLHALESALQEVAWSLGDGLLVPLSRKVPTSEGPVDVRSWTVVLRDSKPPSEFVKLRAYLSTDQTRLNVISICPVQVESDSLSSSANSFSAPLSDLWCEVFAAAWAPKNELSRVAREQSLATWASFLHEAVVLCGARRILQEEFGRHDIRPTWLGPHEDDLRLLIGPKLAPRVAQTLHQFFDEGEYQISSPQATFFAFNALTEKIPARYEDNYLSFRHKLLARSQDVTDAVEAIFYSQHKEIDLASRDERENSEERLEFGISFRHLKAVVSSVCPDVDDYALHWTIDTLIDRGAVVPRHIELTESGRRTWARGFRVGEGPVPTLLHTVRLLFECLSSALGSEELNATVLEKYFALALTDCSDDWRLQALQSLSIEKGFHLYGARSAIVTGVNRQFLIDWAVNHSILRRADSGAEPLFVAPGDIDLVYPKYERPWDRDVREGLEDLAEVVAAIQRTEGLKTAALIALTSAATVAELHKALQVELGLWLDHERNSVYDGLAALAKLAAGAQPPRKMDLEKADRLLGDLSNYTAQANEKLKLLENRDVLYGRIDSLLKGDKLKERTWERLRSRLKGREQAEVLSPGIEQVKSALRIAYQTNRLLRDLLALAGHEDAQRRALPIEQSLRRLLDLMEDPARVDDATRTFFRARDEAPDVASLIASALDGLTADFIGVFAVIRPVVLEISARCADVLKTFGTEEFRENPQPLEPPKYIVMWDIIGSTERESRDELELLIGRLNRRLAATFRDRVMDFRPESRDDGSGAICSTFIDVLALFRILKETFEGVPFRAGCEVNLQGRLNYYPRSKALGGRAYEYAARAMTLYKELKAAPSRWSGAELPPEPVTAYLIVSEFSQRYAVKEGVWPPKSLDVVDLEGLYTPRVQGSLPTKVYLVK